MTVFHESSSAASIQREELLKKRISDFGLQIEGSRLEPLVRQLYVELERAKISFRPLVYLSDEWGCPDGVPVIGVPFFLVDEELLKLEDEIMEGIEAESDDEVMSFLRHEAGHAFNYAYKLYESDEWHRVFGPYSRPYLDDYVPDPFSRQFVRHIPGWYAQKHPDEDFAETFAVWLTPGSNWREEYKDWGCFEKLQYVERVVAEHGRRTPIVDVPDTGFDDLGSSLFEHYNRSKPHLIDIPAYFDSDLRTIFDQPGDSSWESASAFLHRHRRLFTGSVAYWTGLNDYAVRSLVNHLAERAEILNLAVDPSRVAEVLIDLGAFGSTLSMNKLLKGDF